MNYTVYSGLLMVLALGLLGCGGSATPPPTPAETPAPEVAAPETPVAAPAEVAAEVPDEAPAAQLEVQEAAAPAETAPAEAAPPQSEWHDRLVGSAWRLGDFHITFLDQESAKLQGGALTNIMPKGLEAPYTYQEGTITISAMGQTKTLQWDGLQLRLDGIAATRIE